MRREWEDELGKILIFGLLCAGLLAACGQSPAGGTPAVLETPEPTLAPTPEPTRPPLGVEDLAAVLAAVDPSEGKLSLLGDEGEGWFALPYIGDSAPNANDYQASWMIYDEAFEPWYQEAQTAVRYGGTGDGERLSAEELEWFRDYTTSTTQTYDYEWGGWMVGVAPISCFFTSRYSDPRDMEGGELP